MISKSGFNIFNQILCISLERSIERRVHIEKEFRRVGISEFQYVDAFDKSSEEVRKLIDSDFVKKFPPCFRCGLEHCHCPNKSLLHPQIGNWLSHMAAWKTAKANSGSLTLICEDDLKFLPGIHDSLSFIKNAKIIKQHLKSQNPVLIRLGWVLGKDHENTQPPHLTQDLRKSNPCYAINQAMGSLLIDSLEKIDTTSDLYLHFIIGSRVNHFTVMPPPVYELSWSTGELVSEIHPKQKHIDHLVNLLKDLDPHSLEYNEILAKIAKEEERLKRFQFINKNPTLDFID
jgi:hypothetical protein